jgi:3-hydroxyisobutyrate dehydrogenase-like beta-hydroxyacid dehydrogenase
VNVGIVGLGEMGMPMLERLRGADLPVTFIARRPEAVDHARDLGALPVESFADRDVVIVCVYSDDQVRDVCLGPGGILAALRSGATLVNHTTGSPMTAAALAETGRPRGVDVLDAALSGGPRDIASGTLTLLLGGAADVIERVRPVLATYGNPIVHVGGIGDGQRVKLINNAVYGANCALVAEAERVAEALGVDPAVALEAMTSCSGDSRVLRTVVALGSSARMHELAGRFIEKDTATVTHVAEELGVDLGLLRLAQTSQGGTQ